MKKIKLLPLWVVVLCFAMTNVSASVTGGDVTKFEISVVDDLYLGTKYEKVWTISYDAAKAPVTVVKHKTSNGFAYAVHSEFFDVCYSQSSDGFGVRKLRNSLCNAAPEISRAVINPAEMERQRILTPNRVDDDTAIGLIASYLPSLLNPAYTHLLN